MTDKPYDWEADGGFSKAYYVKLSEPMAGVRSEIFFFAIQEEADEFASSIEASIKVSPTGSVIGTETGELGDPREVFPSWSF